MTAKKTQSSADGTLATNLSSEDTRKVLELLKDSKTVELKLSVPMPEHASTVARLGLDPVEAQPRQVYFFDTPDQALNRAGVIVRARRRQGGRADTVVKMRPVDPATIESELKKLDVFKVEVDAMPDGSFVCSASYKGDATGQEVLDVTAGRMPISSLFSKAQRAFYEAHAPAGIDMDSLVVQGPIFLLKAKHQPKEFPRGLTVEVWFWSDGKRILEISTKCEPAEAFQAGVEFNVYATDLGVNLDAKQETKTKTAMAKFKSAHKKSRRKARRRTRKGKAARRSA
jgi:hypothetical protein